MATQNIDIINEENKDDQEKLTDSKLEEIAPINTDIKEDGEFFFSHPCSN